MANLQMPVAELSEAISNDSFDGIELDSDVLESLGIFIVRDLIDTEICAELLSLFHNATNMKVVEGHPTKVLAGTEGLDLVMSSSTVSECFAHFFDGNYRCAAPQIFRKNRDWPDKVKLHNDLMYMSGWQKKYSVFVALTDCSGDNGGLIMYPGTHHFGLLGDAGELDRNALPDGLPAVCPTLRPGDCLFMHSAIWHESNQFRSGGERVYYEFKLVHADDPAYGSDDDTDPVHSYRLPESVEGLFVDSRVQRLQKFYKSQ